MSKKLAPILGVITALAGGFGAVAIAHAILPTAAFETWAAVWFATGALLAGSIASFFFGPKMPKMPGISGYGQQLRGLGFHIDFNTKTSQAGIPIIFGKSPISGNMMYYNVFGSDEDTLLAVMALGEAETVEGIYEATNFGKAFYIDSKYAFWLTPMANRSEENDFSAYTDEWFAIKNTYFSGDTDYRLWSDIVTLPASSAIRKLNYVTKIANVNRTWPFLENPEESTERSLWVVPEVFFPNTTEIVDVVASRDKPAKIGVELNFVHELQEETIEAMRLGLSEGDPEEYLAIGTVPWRIDLSYGDGVFKLFGEGLFYGSDAKTALETTIPVGFNYRMPLTQETFTELKNFTDNEFIIEDGGSVYTGGSFTTYDLSGYSGEGRNDNELIPVRSIFYEFDDNPTHGLLCPWGYRFWGRNAPYYIKHKILNMSRKYETEDGWYVGGFHNNSELSATSLSLSGDYETEYIWSWADAYLWYINNPNCWVTSLYILSPIAFTPRGYRTSIPWYRLSGIINNEITESKKVYLRFCSPRTNSWYYDHKDEPDISTEILLYFSHDPTRYFWNDAGRIFPKEKYCYEANTPIPPNLPPPRFTDWPIFRSDDWDDDRICYKDRLTKEEIRERNDFDFDKAIFNVRSGCSGRLQLGEPKFGGLNYFDILNPQPDSISYNLNGYTYFNYSVLLEEPLITEDFWAHEIAYIVFTFKRRPNISQSPIFSAIIESSIWAYVCDQHKQFAHDYIDSLWPSYSAEADAVLANGATEIRDEEALVDYLRKDPIFQMYGFLTNDRWGANISTAMLDNQSFIDTAQELKWFIDDEEAKGIFSANSNYQFEFSRSVQEDTSLGELLLEMLASFAGQFYFYDGKLHLMWDYYGWDTSDVEGITSYNSRLRSSAIEVNDTHIEKDSLSLNRPNLSDRPTKLRVKYREGLLDYPAEDLEWTIGKGLVQGNESTIFNPLGENISEISLFGVLRQLQAYRLLENSAKKIERDEIVSFTLMPSKIGLFPGDIIRLKFNLFRKPWGYDPNGTEPSDWGPYARILSVEDLGGVRKRVTCALITFYERDLDFVEQDLTSDNYLGIVRPWIPLEGGHAWEYSLPENISAEILFNWSQEQNPTLDPGAGQTEAAAHRLSNLESVTFRILCRGKLDNGRYVPDFGHESNLPPRLEIFMSEEYLGQRTRIAEISWRYSSFEQVDTDQIVLWEVTKRPEEVKLGRTYTFWVRPSTTYDPDYFGQSLTIFTHNCHIDKQYYFDADNWLEIGFGMGEFGRAPYGY